MKGKLLKERLIKSSLFLCAAFSIVLVMFIFFFLVYRGYPAVMGFLLHGLNWFDQASNGEAGSGAIILANIDSTVYLAAGATALAVVIGLPVAIYMAEFSDMRLRNFTKTTMEVLDGFPSIVIGLAGFTLLAIPKNSYTFSGFLHAQAGWVFTGCDLYGWLILMVMSFPIIATISEDALRAVPQDLREASLGIGATKWQTTKEVLLPSAKPRILTSILLALAAAMGEMVALSFVLSGTITGSLITAPWTILNPLIVSNTLSINMEHSYLAALDGAGYPGPSVYFLGVSLFVMVGSVNIIMRRVLAGNTKTTAES
jgi:ABC-type phosphate transport system permease subunit